MTVPIRLNGAELHPDLSGALWWPARRVLVVADLHLEKGSSYARGGQFLPPYDSAETLRQLAGAIRRFQPETVVCLGDSFHDGGAAARLSEGDGAALRALAAERDWVWIEGNHDPQPPDHLGGRVTGELVLGPLLFRHEARPGRVAGEVSGHFHPKATLRVRNRPVSARCFVGDGRRLILPAFGTYTGGLDVGDPAIAGLFPGRFTLHLLGRDRIHALPGRAVA